MTLARTRNDGHFLASFGDHTTFAGARARGNTMYWTWSAVFMYSVQDVRLGADDVTLLLLVEIRGNGIVAIDHLFQRGQAADGEGLRPRAPSWLGRRAPNGRGVIVG